MTRQWRAQDRGDKSLLKMSRLKQKCKSRLDFQTRVTIFAETYIPASRASSWCYAPWPAQRTWLMLNFRWILSKFVLNTFSKFSMNILFKIFIENFFKKKNRNLHIAWWPRALFSILHIGHLAQWKKHCQRHYGPRRWLLGQVIWVW